jgi:hypothetical protein
MTGKTTKPPEATPPAVVPAPLSAPRAPADIEPGTLSGRRNIIATKPREENDAELFAKVKKMSGAEMRVWLRHGDNRSKLEAAQKRKRS